MVEQKESGKEKKKFQEFQKKKERKKWKINSQTFFFPFFYVEVSLEVSYFLKIEAFCTLHRSKIN